MSQGNTFQPPRVPQSQPTPGLEKKMQPPSEATKLETPSAINEYRGSGKLQGKKALITGGEYVDRFIFDLGCRTLRMRRYGMNGNN
jgi:hypothetical protein